MGDAGALEKLLADATASPLALSRALTAHFGIDWFAWTYDALQMTLERELNVAVPATTMSKVMASLAVCTTDAFWLQWEHFHFLVQALNGDVPDFKNHRELSVAQMMRAVTLAEQFRADLGKLSYTPQFSDEVARYVAAQALAEAVWYLPPPLDFAARYASGLRYHCNDCGYESEVMFDDGLCDRCVNRFDTSRLGAWVPDPARLAKGWGSNIRYLEKNPTAPVARRLAEVQASPGRTLQENQVDVCVGKLLGALLYAKHPAVVGAST